MAEVENRIPLGKRLKQITYQAKITDEIAVLTNLLVEAANEGKSQLYFKDLRTVVPNMIANESLWDWLRSEEIGASGGVDQNTATYSYTLYWD